MNSQDIESGFDSPQQPSKAPASDTPSKDFDWCEQCGFPMMLCGHPNLSGEPSLDCKVCILRENLATAQRENAELQDRLEKEEQQLNLVGDALPNDFEGSDDNFGTMAGIVVSQREEAIARG